MGLRLGFLTSHPIQYQVPIFRRLAQTGVEFTALFAMLPDEEQQGDGFGVGFHWDLPLLEGYDYEVLANASPRPAVTAFRGCDTPDVARVIRRLKLDALVVNGWVVKSCLQGLQACRRLNIPCLVRGEANLLRPRPLWKGLGHRLLLRQYAACLYIGAANRAFYVGHGIPASRLFPAYYCVDNDRFGAQVAESAGRVSELRGRFKVPPGVTCFLFSGKLVPKKHPVELLRAFRRLTDKVTGVHLLMVGDGELRRACESYVRDHDLPVSFTGFVNQTEMAEAYMAGDCLVLPSDCGETWGLVVNEAMACGRPAIVSDQVGCAQDLVVEHKTGRTFRFGDWNQLVDRMLEAAGAAPSLLSMGTAAKAHVAAYSPAAACEGIVEAVHAIGGSRRGALT